jgi:hypothetical protein
VTAHAEEGGSILDLSQLKGPTLVVREKRPGVQRIELFEDRIGFLVEIWNGEERVARLVRVQKGQEPLAWFSQGLREGMEGRLERAQRGRADALDMAQGDRGTPFGVEPRAMRGRVRVGSDSRKTGSGEGRQAVGESM